MESESTNVSTPDISKSWRPTIGLILFLGAVFLAAWLGARWTAPAIPTWYASLNKPPFNPPNWVFGPVWTLLYIGIAVSAWWVWGRGAGSKRNAAMGWFSAQLVLNSLWSGVFFTLRQPGWALLNIVLLWIAIAGMILSYRKISAVAAYSQIPYLAWVSFAAFLNFSIWRLNP